MKEIEGKKRYIVKATVTSVGLAIFVVFSVLVSSSWAAKFTGQDASGNRHNGALERRLKWEIKTSNGLTIPQVGSRLAMSNDEQDPFLLRRCTTGK